MNSAAKRLSHWVDAPRPKIRFIDRLTAYSFNHPKQAARLFNIWPPIAGDGIRITEISEDWSHGRLVWKGNWFNRNMHGAAFGGTLFAMTDMLFGTLIMRRMGNDYEAWTRTGTFQFLSPGKRGAYLDVDVPTEMVEWITSVVEKDGYCNVPYTSVIYNPDGSLVGIGQQDLHVRPRRKGIKSHLQRAAEPQHAKQARGLVLESLATAVVWHCFKDQAGVLTQLMSAQRRIPLPEDQMRMVCREALERGTATRDELVELGVSEEYLAGN